MLLMAGRRPTGSLPEFFSAAARSFAEAGLAEQAAFNRGRASSPGGGLLVPGAAAL
ncbi:hypothetical protein ACQPZP_11660 [Spirillospora sp. CA-142024]|uniref:hypothetical protein n=1 Tax=Spirillospora sp. CA-142024 TaxID=3240036 RepID=UPI003D8DFD9A